MIITAKKERKEEKEEKEWISVRERITSRKQEKKEGNMRMPAAQETRSLFSADQRSDCGSRLIKKWKLRQIRSHESAVLTVVASRDATRLQIVTRRVRHLRGKQRRVFEADVGLGKQLTMCDSVWIKREIKKIRETRSRIPESANNEKGIRSKKDVRIWTPDQRTAGAEERETRSVSAEREAKQMSGRIRGRD